MLVLTTNTIELPADGQWTLTFSWLGILECSGASGGDMFRESIEAGVIVRSKEDAGVMVRDIGAKFGSRRAGPPWKSPKVDSSAAVLC